MTQTIFKCFTDLLLSSILSNQERIVLHYSLIVHFFLLILERGLHYKPKLHKLLPFDLGEGTPLQQSALHKLTLFKHTCLNYNTVYEDRQFSRVIIYRRQEVILDLFFKCSKPIYRENKLHTSLTTSRSERRMNTSSQRSKQR